MLSKYGSWTRLLKIKNKLKIACFYMQIKSERFLDILWAFLMKQLFHSRLLDIINKVWKISWHFVGVFDKRIIPLAIVGYN